LAPVRDNGETHGSLQPHWAHTGVREPRQFQQIPMRRLVEVRPGIEAADAD